MRCSQRQIHRFVDGRSSRCRIEGIPQPRPCRPVIAQPLWSLRNLLVGSTTPAADYTSTARKMKMLRDMIFDEPSSEEEDEKDEDLEMSMIMILNEDFWALEMQRLVPHNYKSHGGLQ